MNKYYLFLISTAVTLRLFSQSGPTGVGSSAGNVLWMKADAGTSTTSGTLSVSLLDFSAVQAGNSAQVQWITSSELDNEIFTIERSQDALEYKPIATIDSKAPNGNSSSHLDYAITDGNPPEGINYYRLTQTDINGNIKTFAPVSVWIEKKANDPFVLFPNPCTDKFAVQYSGMENNGQISIALFTMRGKKVYEQTQLVQGTEGSIEVSPGKQLEKGLYTVQLSGGSVCKMLKVLVE